MIKRRFGFVLAALLTIGAPATCAMLGGCGGGDSDGGSPGTTPVLFSIAWPQRSRATTAPASALSAVLTITGAGEGGGDLTYEADRPAGTAAATTTYTTTQRATVGGPYAASLRLFAQTGGQGSLVATASKQVTIAADGSGVGDFALTGTLASVAVAPNQSLAVGQTVDLQFTAQDAHGNTLALTPGSASWSLVTGSSNVTVNQGGTATGLATGTATVTATVDGVVSPTGTISVNSSAPATYALTDLNPQGATLSGAVSVSGGQAAGANEVGGVNHALFWSSLVAVSAIDLNGSLAESAAYGTYGGAITGYGKVGTSKHAMFWPSATQAPVDLSPANGFSGQQWSDSWAYGISGTQIVGYGTSTSGDHALLWTSASPASIVDLHPASGFASSQAYGTDGTHQVGSGKNTAGMERPLLWSGSAASVVDLFPVNGVAGRSLAKATAIGVHGSQIVGGGTGSADGVSHALLWTGPTAASVVDLNPAGYTTSVASDSNGSQQVGYGTASDGHEHALVWSGTAGSVVDLNGYLSSGFTDAVAGGIDSAGNIVGAETNSPLHPTSGHAVVWIPSGRGYRLVVTRQAGGRNRLR